MAMPMLSNGGWGGWILMSLVMIAFLGAVIWAIVYPVRGRNDGGRREEHGSLVVLEERFARGEIDDEEFREQRKTLAGR